MSLKRLGDDFARIFGDYERVFAAPEPTTRKVIESAAKAAAEDRALINASDPTRNEPQAKGNDHV